MFGVVCYAVIITGTIINFRYIRFYLLAVVTTEVKWVCKFKQNLLNNNYAGSGSCNFPIPIGFHAGAKMSVSNATEGSSSWIG